MEKDSVQNDAPDPLSGPIVVAGDVSVDWLEFSVPPQAQSDDGSLPLWREHPRIHRVAREGGALLLAQMLRAATSSEIAAPRLDHLKNNTTDDVLHAIAELGVFDRSIGRRATAGKATRVKTFRGFSGPIVGDPKPLPLQWQDCPQLVVLDDGGGSYRNAEQIWGPLLATVAPEGRVVYKMRRPLARGRLWDAVRTEFGDRLVLVVNADDLRAEGVNLSRGLSWERTAEDFVREISANGSLVSLVTAANLVIRFGCEGAILHHGQSGEPPKLFFDPGRAEGEFLAEHPGTMIGTSTAFTAGLAAYLAKRPLGDIDHGIRAGIVSAKRLVRLGFATDNDNLPCYPINHLFGAPAPDDGIVPTVTIPTARLTHPSAEPWHIIGDMKGTAIEAIAYHLAYSGIEAALASAPVGYFGELVTADRQEIESYRSIARLLREYLTTPDFSKPISIGVFGPPGSGKSFGVAQVAQSVAGEHRIEKLDFNLSQFTSLNDLVRAFHQVRDVTLSGSVPLVFFDEFDVHFEGPLGWLKFFLAPMQDGAFLDSDSVHPIGRAIFVFAGGTAPSLEQFVRQGEQDSNGRTGFAAAKGPDFVSRLRGYVDIRGPDPLSSNDTLFLIRRAMVLRAILERISRNLFDPVGSLKIGEGVLRAFLQVPKYKHGIRSIEAIGRMSTLSGVPSFERSALPPAQQLELHVDARAFHELVAREKVNSDFRETLGRTVHASYLAHRFSRENRETIGGDPAIKQWEELTEDLRESSRLQADDIPRKLRLVGCYMSEEPQEAEPITAFSSEEVEYLAQVEHDRWNAERLQRHWRRETERDAGKRHTPYLVPWQDLTETIKDVDRNAIRSIPAILKNHGIGVFRVR